MNKDQIKGSARETAGRIQKNIGKATANGTQAAKGSIREVAGKIQKGVGNAKEDLKTKRELDREDDEEV
jgi:uncharacterized protein YjbJ (UPF0337 family)